LTPGATNKYKIGLSTTVGEEIHESGQLLFLTNALMSLSTDFVHILDDSSNPVSTDNSYPVIEVRDLSTDNDLNDSGSIKVKILYICP
jgi:hypothetical protein